MLEEAFVLFHAGREWHQLLVSKREGARPWDVCACMVWCEISGRSAQEWQTELQKHEVPGMPWASWDRVAAHMVWELLASSPRVRPGETQGSLFF